MIFIVDFFDWKHPERAIFIFETWARFLNAFYYISTLKTGYEVAVMRCNCNNRAGAINETSTVRQPQYASTSLRDCRTFLASWRQRARYRWLNQLLALSTFPARIFHFDIDLLVALVPRYFAPFRFTRTALDFRRSRIHFYSFPYIDHFGASSFFYRFTSFFLFLPSYFYFLRPILWRNVGSRTGFYTLEKRRVVESRFSDKMIKK